MSFFKFGIEKKWGTQTFLVSYSEIKCFRIDVEPSFVCIHFLDYKIEGFLNHNLYDFSRILKDVEEKKCEYFVLHEESECFALNEEDENE